MAAPRNSWCRNYYGSAQTAQRRWSRRRDLDRRPVREWESKSTWSCAFTKRRAAWHGANDRTALPVAERWSARAAASESGDSGVVEFSHLSELLLPWFRPRTEQGDTSLSLAAFLTAHAASLHLPHLGPRHLCVSTSPKFIRIRSRVARLWRDRARRQWTLSNVRLTRRSRFCAIEYRISRVSQSV